MYKIIIVFLFIVSGLYSQELSEINKLMLDNYRKGNYNAALKFGETALQKTEQKYGQKSDIYITSLSALAIIYSAMDSLQKAEELLKSGIEIINKNNLSANTRIVVYNSLASLYESHEKYSLAEKYYLEAITYMRLNNLTSQESYYRVIKNIAACYDYMGRLNDAEKYYLDAISILKDRNRENDPDFIELNGSLGAIYKKAGKYSKSEEYYSLTLERINKNHSPEEYSFYLNGLGGLYHSMNDYEKTAKYYNESKEIRLRIFGDSSIEYAQSLNNLALLYDDLGKLTESEKFYKIALSIWLKRYGSNSPIYAITLNNLAVLIGKMGRYEEAMELFLESLNIRKKVFGEESLSYAHSLNNSAALFKNLGYLKEAESLLEKSLRLYEEKLGKDHPDYVTALSNLASIYDNTERYSEAEKIYLDALKAREKLFGKKSADYASSLHNTGILYVKMKKYIEADDYLSEAVKIRKDILGSRHLDYILSVSNLARLKEKENKYNESKELWIESLDLYIRQINTIFPALSEDEKTKFYNTINEKFEMFNSFVLRNYNRDSSLLNQLVNYQITIKGLLINNLGKMRSNILTGNDENLKKIYSNWITTKEILAAKYNNSKEELTKVNEIDSLEELANNYERELSSLSEKYTLVYNKVYSINDVRSKLKEGECAIDVIRFRYIDTEWQDSVLYAFIIIKKGKNIPDIVYYTNGNELEERYYNDYISLIKNRINDKVSFKRLFEKVFLLIKDCKRIYFSPDGVFNKINLLSLKESDGSLPMENFDVLTITGMKELFKIRRNMMSKGSAALFGNPSFVSSASSESRDIIISQLPGTEIEINNIKQILDDHKIEHKIYLQRAASVSNLKSIKNPYLLHIATHGFFLQDIEKYGDDNLLGISKEKMKSNTLLRSGLILSGSGEKLSDTSRAGVLTSYEAMNLELDSTEFVILSACETGLGEIRNGEGVYGLQRAFLVAGAKYIIMSLWKVSDQVTSELMTAFYDLYFKSFDVLKAFKEAQLKIKDKYKDTLYWGAFVVLGI